MERALTNFLKDLLVGLIFWALIALTWSLKADELPEVPEGYTVKTPSGLRECYPTEEFRKIVIWIEIAKHFHYVNHELNVLLDTTRAELTVVGQTSEIRASQLEASNLEIKRLQALVGEQQKEYARAERIRKIKNGLKWVGIGLFAAGTITFGMLWGLNERN
jgi:hypothetical protein